MIWVELYNRIVPDVMDKSDVVITCNQKGLYHKHIGYNIGLLYARGQVITICDSDALFPPDFISTIMTSFNVSGHYDSPSSKVLMHYERRIDEKYSEDFKELIENENYKQDDVLLNVKACMSLRRLDALTFGGFDEHYTYKGNLCGPYELGWRLINAGVTENWHHEKTAIWRFAHSDHHPLYSLKIWRQNAFPHIDYHAFNAVKAFTHGRILPLKENHYIHEIRLKQRQIGSRLEGKYAEFAKIVERPKRLILVRVIAFFLEPMIIIFKSSMNKLKLLQN
ncbi:conserved hypothetical protein [delta proteobacterium NaphS2]|nr:conserved hypothetical protein [delta proteobacterium NaphS2]